MKTNRKIHSGVVVLAFLLTLAALPSRSLAQTWSVQVAKVDPGDVNIEPAFRVAIYENLLVELAKTMQFKQVFRLGDRNSSGPEVLVLKTTVQKYTPGSETRRAVTTVGGATKLNVRSELSTREGKVVVERIVNGNVRFFGGNLRATHNLAHNIAGALKKSDLPASTLAVREQK
jgi:hypothetical protein